MNSVTAGIDDYPLSERQPERLKTPSGLPFTEIDLEAVLAGKIQMEDLRVTSGALGIASGDCRRCRATPAGGEPAPR